MSGRYEQQGILQAGNAWFRPGGGDIDVQAVPADSNATIGASALMFERRGRSARQKTADGKVFPLTRCYPLLRRAPRFLRTVETSIAVVLFSGNDNPSVRLGSVLRQMHGYVSPKYAQAFANPLGKRIVDQPRDPDHAP